MRKSRHGYKLVKWYFGKEIEIPEDWEERRFGDIVTKTQLGTGKVGIVNGCGIPLIKMGNVTFGGFDFTKLEYIQLTEVENGDSYLLQTNDFLFNTRNSDILVGKCAVWKGFFSESIFNNNLMRISFSEEIENSDYVSYFLNSLLGRKSLRRLADQTTSVAAIYYGSLKLLKLFLPTAKEQQKIVSIISSIDNLIHSYDEIIVQKEKLKSSLMEKTFEEITKEKKKTSLENHFKIQSGEYFLYEEFSDTGIPVLKIDNVMHGQTSWDVTTYLPKKYLESHKHLVLKEDDIILALNRPITHNKLKIAKLTKNDYPAILYQRVGRFIFLDSEIDKSFFFAMTNLRIFKKIISRILVGSDQPYIKTTELLRQKIAFPDIKDQIEFSKLNIATSKEIILIKNQKESLESLKKGLMQKLLTGQIRVQV